VTTRAGGRWWCRVGVSGSEQEKRRRVDHRADYLGVGLVQQALWPEVQPLTRNDLNLVYPYVVPRSWVDYAGRDALVTWEFAEDVHMVLVTDRLESVQNVRPQDLDSVNETLESAFEIAAQNLARAFQQQAFQMGDATLRDGKQIGFARGNWMAPAGGLMLGALYQRLQQLFRQDEFAAIAVNQPFPPPVSRAWPFPLSTPSRHPALGMGVVP
jgi:hypothetical protein